MQKTNEEKWGKQMKRSFQIGAAFIGVIVGAGFASGQEVLQFFTSFGIPGLLGGAIALTMFAFLGMVLGQLGCRLQTKSHEGVIYHICGKYLGIAVDVILTFFLFGVAVVMFAGSGAIFEEQFGIPAAVGNLFMTTVVIISVLFDVKRVIALIGSFTPILMLTVLIMAIYSVLTADLSSLTEAATVAADSQAAPNWILAALLYVSYNIAVGAPLVTVMGGTVRDDKVVARGAIIGGIGLGILVLLISISMMTQLGEIADAAMPMLVIANNISPIVGIVISVILLGMIYNTAVGMLYTFSVRLIKPGTKKFKVSVVLFGIIAFICSNVGFVNLVGTVYPIMGYLGFVLIAAIIVSWMKNRKKTTVVSIE
ncbi:hypothetical protein ACFOZY_08330 [Chungangia koreensis]|uniref:Membrane protein YkvI n=2 Tax=Chungangia koreensis TaxID=752657 RepID=A0ABV8X5K3_9LACT